MLRQWIADGSIDDEAALVALYDFETWFARDNQLAPSIAQNGKPWAVWLGLAGRGFGKTRMGVEWANKQAKLKPEVPGAIIGRTAADSRDVLVEGPSGILAMSPPWFRPLYEPAKRRLTWPNGARATLFSAEAPDQLRGPQHGWALADELAAWAYAQETWDNLMLGLRLGDNPQVAALTTPRPLEFIRDVLKDPATAITRGSTLDNAMNLAKRSLDYLQRKYGGTRLGRQELEGELLDDLPGALWTRAAIEACVAKDGVVFKLEDFERIVVAVDPSGSDGNDQGDDQGIVVAGKLAGRDHYVVMEDRTDQRSPEEWARVAVGRQEDLKADTIVVEKNFGGDMCRAVIHGFRSSAPVKIANASRGKHVRAEPVSMLYEQGKVTHVRGLGALEDELTQFTGAGYQGGSSPNRADAAIWAITELTGGSEPRIRRL